MPGAILVRQKIEFKAKFVCYAPKIKTGSIKMANDVASSCVPHEYGCVMPTYFFFSSKRYTFIVQRHSFCTIWEIRLCILFENYPNYSKSVTFLRLWWQQCNAKLLKIRTVHLATSFISYTFIKLKIVASVVRIQYRIIYKWVETNIKLLCMSNSWLEQKKLQQQRKQNLFVSRIQITTKCSIIRLISIEYYSVS